jgi:hypothetical protein
MIGKINYTLKRYEKSLFYIKKTLDELMKHEKEKKVKILECLIKISDVL